MQTDCTTSRQFMKILRFFVESRSFEYRDKVGDISSSFKPVTTNAVVSQKVPPSSLTSTVWCTMSSCLLDRVGCCGFRLQGRRVSLTGKLYLRYRNRHLPLTLFISRLTFHLHLRLRAHFSTAYSFDLKMEASDSIETYVTLCYRRLRIRQ
jgi:hypothetical protein